MHHVKNCSQWGRGRLGCVRRTFKSLYPRKSLPLNDGFPWTFCLVLVILLEQVWGEKENRRAPNLIATRSILSNCLPTSISPFPHLLAPIATSFTPLHFARHLTCFGGSFWVSWCRWKGSRLRAGEHFTAICHQWNTQSVGDTHSFS